MPTHQHRRVATSVRRIVYGLPTVPRRRAVSQASANQHTLNPRHVLTPTSVPRDATLPPGKPKPGDVKETPQQRRERDAKALQEKLARKKAAAAGGGAGGGAGAGGKGGKKGKKGKK